SFAYFEAAQAVNDGEAMNSEFFADVRGDFLNLGDGHGLVGLVLQVTSAAIVGMVAHKSIKNDDGAVCASTNVGGKGRGAYGSVNEFDNVAGSSGHADRSAAAHGGQESNFIAGVKSGVPGGEFAIAGCDQRRAILVELGKTRDVGGENSFDVCVAG